MDGNQRPFRFGVQISRSRSRANWKDQVRRAESLGYDILLMPDHFADQFAIAPALAVAAESTTNIRFGTLVYQNDLRHPVLVAQEAATLDVLSDGRFELGIGAGGSASADYDQTGIRFDPPGTRVDRLEESVQIIKGLFSEGPLTFVGQQYTISDLEGYPKPVQRPYPPVLIGGGGPRMLTLAARHADIVSVFPSLLPKGGAFRIEEGSTAEVARKVAFLRQAAGDRFSQLELNVLVQLVIISPDRQAEIERLSTEWGTSADLFVDSPYFYIGTVEEIADEIRAYRERLGISYFVVFERDMDAFATVMATLVAG